MKKLAIIGSALGASLLQILARGGWETVGHTSPSRATRKEQRARRSFLYLPAPRPTDARHWHNPADPHQAARIEAAAAKRARKAQRLAEFTGRATFFNYAHAVHCIAFKPNLSLNPTYVAK